MATEINADLFPVASSNLQVGTLGKEFLLGWFKSVGVLLTGSGGLNGRLSYNQIQLPSLNFAGTQIYSQHPAADATKALALSTADGNDTDGVQSSPIRIETGNRTAGVANTGDIALRTGSATGFRGKIRLDAVMNLPTQAAPTDIQNGDMWFDGTNLNLRVGGVTRTVMLV